MVAEGRKSGPARPFFCGGVCGAVVVCARWCPTLPHPGGCSTIGAGWLSFRVRDGSGRFPAAVTTETSMGVGRPVVGGPLGYPPPGGGVSGARLVWAAAWGGWLVVYSVMWCDPGVVGSVVACGWLGVGLPHTRTRGCGCVWVVGLVVDRIVGAWCVWCSRALTHALCVGGCVFCVGRLVPVSLYHYWLYTSSLSTQWSTGGLPPH